MSKDLLFTFSYSLNHLRDFKCHWDEILVVRLVHKAFEVLRFVIEFFLDVELHFVRDKTTGDFFCELSNKCVVVRGKILRTLLVRNFENTNRMVAQLDRHK